MNARRNQCESQKVMRKSKNAKVEIGLTPPPKVRKTSTIRRYYYYSLFTKELFSLRGGEKVCQGCFNLYSNVAGSRSSVSVTVAGA